MSQPSAAPRAHRAPRWLLPAIILIAVLLRVYKLDSLPPGLFRDEAEKGFNAWLLWLDGRDSHGKVWPLFIQVFGVTTSAIYQYAALPFVALAGPNEWSVRLPSALAGTITVWLAWLLGRRTGGWQAGTVAAAFLAISPWHVPLSRWAQQGIFLPLFVALGVYGVALLLGRGSTGHPAVAPPSRLTLVVGSVASAVGFGLAIYSYDPARLFVPLLLLVILALWYKEWLSRWRYIVAGAVMFMLVVSPVANLILTDSGSAMARFQFLSIAQPGMSPWAICSQFLHNYASHFSPRFLLISGDAELRHSAGVGMLNIAELGLAMVGAVFAIARRDKWLMLILAWVLLAPVPASLTRVGVPHALRAQVALPAWQILAGAGMVLIAGKLTRRGNYYRIAILIALLGFLPFALSYFGTYKYRSAFAWQHGVKDALGYLSNPNAAKATVYLHNIVGADYLVPFYEKMNRQQYRAFISGQTRYHLMDFQQPDRPVPAGDSDAPIAWLTPPGYSWPANCSILPIILSGGERYPQTYWPSTLIIMNPALVKQIDEIAEK